MPVSVEYFARETASNLWRNRLMTIAAVLTVAVSLSLVGVSLLLQRGVGNATTQWQRGVNVLVWVSPGIATTNEKAIHDELVQLPYVRTCAYRSQQYDFAEATRLLPPDESQALSASTTPASLRCILQNPNQAQAIVQEFSGRPGVADVSYPSQAVRTMEHVTSILRWVFLALALILLMSAAVLILNTIRLAIFARRREVSVMKLVGATNWFIRVPFMCEGLTQGVLGALVAVSVVLGLHWLLDDLGHGSSLIYQMRVTGPQVIITSVVVLLVGVVVGTFGSAFAIRRFLDA